MPVQLIIQFSIPVLLIVIGYIVGHIIERRHFRSIQEREARPGPVLTNLSRIPAGMTVESSQFVIGSVVIASDYFKFVGANLKTLVGGRLRTLETLLERGRREALLRLREQAATSGANMVMNVRLETSVIMRSKKSRSSPAAEVVAYGTALRLRATDGGP